MTVSWYPRSVGGQTLERYQLGNEEGAMDRGPRSPRRGFEEEGKLSQTPRGLLGEEWAAVGEEEELFQETGPCGQSGR